MSDNSVSSTVIITRTTEHKVESNFYLVIISQLRSSLHRQLKTYQKGGIKRHTRTSYGDIANIASVMELGTLRQVSGHNGRVHRILGKRRCRLLVGRPVCTNLIIRRQI